MIEFSYPKACVRIKGRGTEKGDPFGMIGRRRRRRGAVIARTWSPIKR